MSVTYHPEAQLAFVRRLSDDWIELSIMLGIPSHDVNAFAPGKQALAIWGWLDRRQRLGELPAALAAAGRQDLADLLRGKVAERSGPCCDRDATTPQRVGCIPARSAAFVGRTQLLDRLTGALSSAPDTMVVLHGIGGVGKTQAAIEYAHRYGSTYDIVWWIDAGDPLLISPQIAALGAALGVADDGVDVHRAVSIVRVLLKNRPRWLLIFDNANEQEHVGQWNGHRDGHVLVTSRSPIWTSATAQIEVKPFSRPESVSLLMSGVHGLDEAAATALAIELDDLPLALGQAVKVMANPAMPADSYLAAFREAAIEVLDDGRPMNYGASLTGVVRHALRRLSDEDGSAADLARMWSLLSPTAIPLRPTPASDRPASAFDAYAYRQRVGSVTRVGLASADHGFVTMHRLTQIVVRNSMTPAQLAAARVLAGRFLVALHPGTGESPRTWDTWGRVIPHLLAFDLETTDNPALRKLGCDAVWYLYLHGNTEVAYPFAKRWYEAWRARLGPDDETTLAMAAKLCLCLFRLGRLEEAHALADFAWKGRRKTLGEEHPATLASAFDLALMLRMLGHVREAFDIWSHTLETQIRTQGIEHACSLRTASYLATSLQQLGRLADAHELAQDTLSRQQRILGDDHPDTLNTAANLANSLRELGHLQRACSLAEETLERRTRILGPDHPSTRASAGDLTAIRCEIEKAE